MTPPFPFVAKPSSFPNSFKRTFKPRVLQVVHVTGNKDVAALPDGLTPGHSPYQDWLYAGRNPDSADGPSANNYVGREGSTIEMWDPRTNVAWSNGDLKSPRLDLPGVKYLADLRAKGVNANKGCYREIELSGYPGSFDPTDAQIEVCAWFAATDSIETGIDIVLHETVLTHAYINTVDRQNCAFRPAIRETRLGQIVSRALEIRKALTEGDMQTTVTVQSYPPRTFTTKAGLKTLRRFNATAELAPITALPYSAKVDADVTIEHSDNRVPHGPGFLRMAGGGSAGFYILAAEVDLAPLSDPVTAALDHVRGPAQAVLTAIDEATPR